MLPSAYGWAGVAGIVLVLVVLVAVWIRRSRARAVEARDLAAKAAAIEREAAAHAAVSDVRGRDLGPEPGLRVRRAPKRAG